MTDAEQEAAELRALRTIEDRNVALLRERVADLEVNSPVYRGRLLS